MIAKTQTFLQLIPIAYFLMERRTTAAYKAAFEAYNEVFGDLKPTSVMSDYEESLRSAVNATWPTAHLYGCWFHYAQAVLRKAVKLGLTHGEYAEGIQTAMTLPLLPRCKVQAGMRIVQDMLGEAGAGKKLCSYLEAQWSAKDISVFGTTSRTNNFAESFHRDLMRTFHSSHPNVWHFVNKIREVNNDKSMDMRRLQLGTTKAPHKRVHEVVKNTLISKAQNVLEQDGDVPAFLTETRHIMGHVYARSLQRVVDDADGSVAVVFTDVQYLHVEDEGGAVVRAEVESTTHTAGYVPQSEMT